MNNEIPMLPKIGTKITYAEAFAKYDALEGYMLSKVYSPDFVGNVKAYDMLWHLDDIATKYGIANGRSFHNLHELLYRFAIDRTALANGANGKRFYMLNDTQTLAKHDESHLFEVGVDAEKLLASFSAFLEVLHKASAKTDGYAETYSPDWPNRHLKQERAGERLARTIFSCLIILWVALGAWFICRAIFALGV